MKHRLGVTQAHARALARQTAAEMIQTGLSGQGWRQRTVRRAPGLTTDGMQYVEREVDQIAQRLAVPWLASS